jgi:ubiquinone/menaquinone biosynthesis C-methylase UbiE
VSQLTVAEPDTPSSLTDEIRRKYDDFAETYDRIPEHRLLEKLYLGRCRQRLVSRARGKVLEVAVGTGVNLPFYSSDCELTAIDLSPAMLGVARRRATSLGRKVRFEVMDAEHLDFPSRSFDTVVSSLSTCTFPEPMTVLQEMARVCTPGGRILLLEHGRSSREWLGRLQDRLAGWHYKRLSCRWNQHPLAVVQEAGLHVTSVQRSSALGIFSEIEAQPGA